MPKIKLIQCGVGHHGKSWSEVTPRHDDFDLVAIVDIVPAALEAAGAFANLPRDRWFSSLDEAVEKVDADAVLTVTPPLVHVEHAKLAFSRGMHLITEKPIADSLANAKLMVDLAERANRQLMVTQNYRYMPAPRRLRSLLAEKPVGELGHGHIDFYIAGDFTGSFRQTMDYPLLVDMAIHHLDLLRAVTGKNIRRVTAHTFNPSWSWYQHHAGLKMFLELDGNIHFSYSGDWSAKGKQTPWGGAWRLQCERGSIHYEGENVSIGHGEFWGKDQRMDAVEVPQFETSGQSLMLSDFAKAIRTGHPAECAGRDNLQSFAAIMAGVKSAKEGRAVEVAEFLAG